MANEYWHINPEPLPGEFAGLFTRTACSYSYTCPRCGAHVKKGVGEFFICSCGKRHAAAYTRLEITGKDRFIVDRVLNAAVNAPPMRLDPGSHKQTINLCETE